MRKFPLWNSAELFEKVPNKISQLKVYSFSANKRSLRLKNEDCLIYKSTKGLPLLNLHNNYTNTLFIIRRRFGRNNYQKANKRERIRLGTNFRLVYSLNSLTAWRQTQLNACLPWHWLRHVQQSCSRLQRYVNLCFTIIQTSSLFIYKFFKSYVSRFSHFPPRSR